MEYVTPYRTKYGVATGALGLSPVVEKCAKDVITVCWLASLELMVYMSRVPKYGVVVTHSLSSQPCLPV